MSYDYWYVEIILGSIIGTLWGPHPYIVCVYEYPVLGSVNIWQDLLG